MCMVFLQIDRANDSFWWVGINTSSLILTITLLSFEQTLDKNSLYHLRCFPLFHLLLTFVFH